MAMASLKTVFTLVVMVIATTASSSSETPKGEFAGPIKKVVLLMLENRAFDHMAGKFPVGDTKTQKENHFIEIANCRSLAS